MRGLDPKQVLVWGAVLLIAVAFYSCIGIVIMEVVRWFG